MKNLVLIFFFLHSVIAQSQSEFCNSKIDFYEHHLANFYSSVSIDSTQVYFNANDYSVHAHDKKTGILNWSYYTNSKSNDAPRSQGNNVFVRTTGGKCEQLNAKTGELVQALQIEELTTTPFIKDTIMYCAGVSPRIGGAILAYDLKNNQIVWEKYTGHGVSFQPYFFKDRIVANYEGSIWFEVDYNGNLLDKDSTCYYKNSEPPFEESYCNIHYDLLHQNNKDLVEKNVSIENTKYHYANDVTIILENDKITIINNRNKIAKEINVKKIIALPKTSANGYREILKVEDNTIWFFYENTLAVYDFKKKKTIKTYDLTSWNAHQVILDGNNLWLISKNNAQLVGLKLDNEL